MGDADRSAGRRATPATVSNVVFDCGGVLLRWNPDAIVRGLYPHPGTAARVRAAVFDHPDWLALDRGTLTDSDAVHRFHLRCGRPAAEMRTLLRTTWESLQPVTETLAIVEELAARGVRLFILSNMAVSTWRYLSRRYSFWSHFEGILVSGHVRLLKPEPAIFEHLLARHALDPARTLFIDDVSANVHGARAAGMQALQFVEADQCRRDLRSYL